MTKAGTVPEPGDIIAGKYRVERTLGIGGMGAVLEVSHQVTHKRFAIKWMLPELCKSQEAAARFIREAQVVGSFDHRNVVQVYDLGQDEGAPFMVMELLQGESLACRIKRLGRLSATEACAILIPCMQVLSAAHALGVVHRDVKPANIFLCTPTGPGPEIPKLLDFGIAKLMPDRAPLDSMRTQTGAIIGTPHYMAPEQMRGWPVDPRADVYALGITLYEVLSGSRPFEATTYADLIIKVGSEQAEPLEDRVPDLPAGLGALVARAMARDPNERFPNVDELLGALLPYAGGPAPVRSSTLPTLPDEQASEMREPSTPTPLFGESELGLSTVAASSSAARWGFRAALVALAALGVGLVWYGRLDRASSDVRAASAVSVPPPMVRGPAPLVDAGVRPATAPWVEPSEVADVQTTAVDTSPSASVAAEAQNPSVTETDLASAPSAKRALSAASLPPVQDVAAAAKSQAAGKAAPMVVVPVPPATKQAATRPFELGTSEEPGVSVRQAAPTAAGEEPASLRMRLQGEPTLPEARHGRARPNVGLATDDFMVPVGEGARSTSRPTPHMDSDDF